MDFQWANALDFAGAAGLVVASPLRSTDTLTRDIAAQLTYNALSCLLADGSETLCQRLVDLGCMDGVLAGQLGLPVGSGFGIAADAA